MSGWLPPGLFAYGAELAAGIDRRLGRVVLGDGADWIDLPRRLRIAEAPSEPVRWGDGYLCVDLGPDDGPAWERFAEAHRDDPDPEAVAVAAQQWRLPVTPYRRLRCTSGGAGRGRTGREGVGGASATADLGEFGHTPAPASLGGVGGVSAVAELGGALDPERSMSTAGRGGVGGACVVEVAAMWAAPLCTHILRRAGATVTKVDADIRPDGLRGSEMYDVLNEGKRIVSWNLEDAGDRAEFLTLIERCDLLVTSLSQRALANLALLPQDLCKVNPSLHTLALTAFDADAPEGHWVAYGTGVHAASGLGWQDAHVLPTAPAYSYPDPLAGLAMTVQALDLLHGTAAQHQRASLAAAAQPLADRAVRVGGDPAGMSSEKPASSRVARSN